MNLWKMTGTFLKMAFFKMAANAIIKKILSNIEYRMTNNVSNSDMTNPLKRYLEGLSTAP